MTNWLHRIILWLDRPHHRDWRPAPYYGELARRWRDNGWEYRPMTDEELMQDMQDRAW